MRVPLSADRNCASIWSWFGMSPPSPLYADDESCFASKMLVTSSAMLSPAMSRKASSSELAKAHPHALLAFLLPLTHLSFDNSRVD